MSRARNSASLTLDQWHAVTASFLGWTLDAFDFFVLVFLLDVLAAQFHVAKAAMVWTITATLAMRPVGALIFGLVADRYGRRKPLMLNVVFFSVVELLCGFAPSYTVFLVLRTIYGIGMGGEWGVGASLAMENAPARWRGILSLASCRADTPSATFWRQRSPLTSFFPLSDGAPCSGWAAHRRCWRSISAPVKESEAWEQHRAPTVSAIIKTARGHWKIFSYLTLPNDVNDVPFPRQPGSLSRFSRRPASLVARSSPIWRFSTTSARSSVPLVFGFFSERLGRRRSTTQLFSCQRR